MKNKAITLISAMVLSLSTFAATIDTDRTWYLAGEAMTVSVTADNAMIAYAELCDRQSMVAGVVVSLKEGAGIGVIELPSDLHSGYYVLSVYTRGDAKVSNRLVAVVNPLRKSVGDDIEWVPDTLSHAFSDVNFASADLVCEKTADVHETEGHIMKARVKNVNDGHTFSNSEICPSMSIIGKQIHYFEGKMENDSIAAFYVFGIQGRLQLVLSARSSSGVSLPIELISPFASLLPKKLPHLVFHYNRSEVEARSLDMQRHQMSISRQRSTVSPKPLDYDDKVLGTQPDLSYNLDEYRQFLTIREVLLEYVSCVSKRTFNGVQMLIVRKEQDHYNSVLPTLVLIDGMPVFDIERLLNYDARRIHFINVYGGQYTFGKGVYNGILSFVTRSGQLTNYPTEPNMQYLVYDFPE